jgi:NAD(P)-dependent dehydrogenase (short-subunit alcohol dehydrogenase family)
MTKKRVCAVVGVGPGNGAALGRRFAQEGYAVALLARTTETSEALAKTLEDARAYACDVSDADSVTRAFEAIEREMGPVYTLAYNAEAGTWGTVDEITPAALEGAFRVNTLGLLLASQKVIPQMKAQGGWKHRRRRRNVFTPRRRACGCVRPGEGRAEEPRRVDGPTPLAPQDPRFADHRRRRRGSASHACTDEGQARRLLRRPRRRRRHCVSPHHAASVGVVVRG